MKLWLISQKENNGYDTYDSAVVSAETEDAAKQIHPSGYQEWVDNCWWTRMSDGTKCKSYTSYLTWASNPNLVTARYLGESSEEEKSIICASFNEG